jgi:hypothetical protein
MFNNTLNADKRIALLSTGHEPVMLLLHQSALVFVFSAHTLCFRQIFFLEKKNKASDAIAIYFSFLARGLNNYVSQSESKAKAKRKQNAKKLFTV